MAHRTVHKLGRRPIKLRSVPLEIVPETLYSSLGDGRAAKPLPKVVEEGKLVTIENVVIRLRLYAPPKLADGGFED